VGYVVLTMTGKFDSVWLDREAACEYLENLGGGYHLVDAPLKRSHAPALPNTGARNLIRQGVESQRTGTTSVVVNDQSKKPAPDPLIDPINILLGGGGVIVGHLKNLGGGDDKIIVERACAVCTHHVDMHVLDDDSSTVFCLISGCDCDKVT
jgi:hypothetical protein